VSLVVIDASLTMVWYFEDESTPETDAVLDQVSDAGAIVPSIWRLEVVNALQTAMRRGRIDASYRDDSLNDLGQMAITIDPDTDGYVWTRTLRFADRCNLTIYDAAYLELAERKRLPLGTLDRELRRAAADRGVTLLGV
jgi:predicted nucleic acid-binding protein